MDSNYDGGWMDFSNKSFKTEQLLSIVLILDHLIPCNETNVNRDDGDAKYEVMNHFLAKDMMAIFPDIQNIGTESGSIDNLTVWSWLKNLFYNTFKLPYFLFFLDRQ